MALKSKLTSVSKLINQKKYSIKKEIHSQAFARKHCLENLCILFEPIPFHNNDCGLTFPRGAVRKKLQSPQIGYDDRASKCKNSTQVQLQELMSLFRLFTNLSVAQKQLHHPEHNVSDGFTKLKKKIKGVSSLIHLLPLRDSCIMQDQAQLWSSRKQ